MGISIGMNQAKALLADGIKQAEGLLKNPPEVDELLIQFENRLKEVPAVGETLANIPLTISLIKGYITRQYTEVSPKVILSLVGAVIYMVRKQDLISDDLPVIGLADDIAVLALALKSCEPELQAFAAWRAANQPEEVRAMTEEAAEEMHAEAEATEYAEYAEAAAKAEAWAEAEAEGDPEI